MAIGIVECIKKNVHEVPASEVVIAAGFGGAVGFMGGGLMGFTVAVLIGNPAVVPIAVGVGLVGGAIILPASLLTDRERCEK